MSRWITPLILGFICGSATAQSVPPLAWADSSGVWAAEVAIFDGADALTAEESHAVHDCALEGLRTKATNGGSAGVESLTSARRLYIEVSVLPNDAGLVGYITIGLRAADGRLVEQLASFDAPAEDADGLCAAVQDGIVVAKLRNM